MPNFYGTTKSGKRLHMGQMIMAGRGRSDEVETFCGCVMFTVDLEAEHPPVARVDEFCKLCFRTYAWQAMINQVAETAALVTWFDKTVEAARQQRWTANDFMLVLKEKADLLRSLLGPEAPENVVNIASNG